MLVLSRKLLEKIIVKAPTGEQIVITVLDIDRGKIRLGLIAPKEFEIMREELVPLHQRPPENYGRKLAGRP